MNQVHTVENGQTVLQYVGDDGPLAIHQYVDPGYRREPRVVAHVVIDAQIFHTDLHHFPLDKAAAVDNDFRRPIYQFRFDSIAKATAFVDKRDKYFLSYRMTEIDSDFNQLAYRYIGKGPTRLRYFATWLEHVMEGLHNTLTDDAVSVSKACWFADCHVVETDGNVMVGGRPLTNPQIAEVILSGVPVDTPEIDLNKTGEAAAAFRASIQDVLEKDRSTVH